MSVPVLSIAGSSAVVNREGERSAQHAVIAFGDLLMPHGSVLTASHILHRLLDMNSWLLPTNSAVLKPGMLALFYQKSVGFVATAMIGSVERASRADAMTLLDVELPFALKLALSEIALLDPPVDIRPILAQLGFIRNKTFWGHSLRKTPRLIAISDFSAILSLTTLRKANSES